MKLRTLKYLSLLFLTGCFYSKIKLTSSDQKLIPYHNSFQLIFKDKSNLTDTLNFIMQPWTPSSLDFFVSKSFTDPNDKKRPFMVKYSTDIAVNRIIDTSSNSQPLIKYDPITFILSKKEKANQIDLFYSINGKWYGTVSLDTVKTMALTINNVTLSDVFLINNTSQPLFEINTLYWSLQYGLVGIEEKSGHSWTLIRRSY